MSAESKSHLFQKGNPGGPGRPKRKKVDYRGIFDSCVTADAFFHIIERAVQDAKAGNWRAREWLISYLPIHKTACLRPIDFVPITPLPVGDSFDDEIADESYRDLLDACQTVDEIHVAIRLAERLSRNRQQQAEQAKTPNPVANV